MNPPRVIPMRIVDSSIRKNPNAGRQAILIPRASTATAQVENWFMPSCPEYARATGYDDSGRFGRGRVMYSYVMDGLRAEAFVEHLVEQGVPRKDIRVDVRYDHERIDLMRPEPDYLFEYEDPEIPCESCDAKPKLSEVVDVQESDETSYEACPKCSTYLRFDLEHETVQDALYRIANQEGG